MASLIKGNISPVRNKIAVKARDNVSVSLPATTATVIDGVSIATGDLFLFTNLTVDNNRVFRASVSGVNITWVVQVFGFNIDGTPANGDEVFVLEGSVFQFNSYQFRDGAWFSVEHLSGDVYFTAYANIAESKFTNCSHSVLSSKSRITFTSDYPVNLNPGEEAGSALDVFIDGQLIPRYSTNVASGQAYFKEISSTVIELDADYSLASVDMAFRVPQLIIDSQSQNTSELAVLNESLSSGFNSFVKEELLDAPHTAIVNRAKVQTNSLKAVGPIERIPFTGLNLLPNEVGPNGETIFELPNKDNRIRFVGNWTTTANQNGAYNSTPTQYDTLEIVFYGTGLNILCQMAGTVRDYRVSIDGASYGTNIYPASGSPVLDGRNYAQNVILNATSGLSEGLHIVKISNYSTSGAAFFLYGIEILNQASSLSILPGSGFLGTSKETISAVTSSNFNTGVVGTKGARIVKYLLDDTISQVITECATSPSYLTSTSHLLEDQIRKINFREFGAQRGDDFSTLSTSDSSRAFTLDDGTTTLVAYECRGLLGSVDSLQIHVNSRFFTITFVGTGLDITRVDSNNGSTCSVDIYVDGVNIGTSATSGSTNARIQKICSGLPYGTHTVRFIRTTAVDYAFGVQDFIIYQPKKPTIPTGAIELADYCVMADFVANTTPGLETISTGTLRKANIRELVYTGTVSIASMSVPDYIDGLYVYASATNSAMEYNFYGTGFDLRFQRNTSNGSGTIYVDGLIFNTTNFPVQAAAATTYPSGQFNPSTGILSYVGTLTRNCGFVVSGLSLGLHKFKIVAVSASDMNLLAIDIITPIYFNNPKVGSNSLSDSRKFSPIAEQPTLMDLSKAKAWCVFDGVNNKIISSYNISQVLSPSAGQYMVFFSKQFKGQGPITIASSDLFHTTISYITNKLRSYAEIATMNSAHGYASANHIFFACFGELADE